MREMAPMVTLLRSVVKLQVQPIPERQLGSAIHTRVESTASLHMVGVVTQSNSSKAQPLVERHVSKRLDASLSQTELQDGSGADEPMQPEITFQTCSRPDDKALQQSSSAKEVSPTYSINPFQWMPATAGNMMILSTPALGDDIMQPPIAASCALCAITHNGVACVCMPLNGVILVCHDPQWPCLSERS